MAYNVYLFVIMMNTLLLDTKRRRKRKRRTRKSEMTRSGAGSPGQTGSTDTTTRRKRSGSMTAARVGNGWRQI